MWSWPYIYIMQMTFLIKSIHILFRLWVMCYGFFFIWTIFIHSRRHHYDQIDTRHSRPLSSESSQHATTTVTLDISLYDHFSGVVTIRPVAERLAVRSTNWWRQHPSCNCTRHLIYSKTKSIMPQKLQMLTCTIGFTEISEFFSGK